MTMDKVASKNVAPLQLPEPLSVVKVTKQNIAYEGILLPSSTSSLLQLKLSSGYNISLATQGCTIEVIAPPAKKAPACKYAPAKKEQILILHTGGTIASRIDYDTGAVVAGYEPEDLIKRYPAIKPISTRFLANIQSEMIRFAHYNLMAKTIAEEIKAGVKAIILTHGTDTMHYTSAALSFMLEHLPIPVILVGAQRSSDRPSTDATENITFAVQFAREAISLGISGVFIVMHSSMNDGSCYILSGLNARKMHTSRRDAFLPINTTPFATITKDGIKFFKPFPPLPTQPLTIKPFNEELKVGFIKTHPHMHKEELLGLQGFDGIILEGTGLGHAPIDVVDEYTAHNQEIANAIKTLIASGTCIAVAPQTIYGRINLNVYSPQRRLRALGVFGHLCDMSPETAFIKLSWLLSNYPKDQVPMLYEQNLRGEISAHSYPGEYPNG